MDIAEVPQPSIGELISLKGRTAIVTGAGQGIGLAVAQRLAEAGAAVFLGDLNSVAAESAAAQLAARFGGKALGGFLDVGDPDCVGRVVAEVGSKLGPVDILVNNAGIYPPALLQDLDFDAWRRVMQVNLDGAFLCTRAVAKAMMKDSRKGVIVNITSTGQTRATLPGMSVYVSSKHGLDGITKSLALELGPHGIRVMSVAPSMIVTPGLRDLHAKSAGAGAAEIGDVANQVNRMIPLHRPGTTDDVARAVLFCASELAAFVSGSTIYVDGGAMTV